MEFEALGQKSIQFQVINTKNRSSWEIDLPKKSGLKHGLNIVPIKYLGTELTFRWYHLRGVSRVPFLRTEGE